MLRRFIFKEYGGVYDKKLWSNNVFNFYTYISLVFLKFQTPLHHNGFNTSYFSLWMFSINGKLVELIQKFLRISSKYIICTCNRVWNETDSQKFAPGKILWGYSQLLLYFNNCFNFIIFNNFKNVSASYFS